MVKKNPAVSIIVPVYKAEAYLHRCVDSLLAQTFTDFEVLLIDDGSPDRSGEICDDYARKDARVRVFHQTNGGVSVARQRGLDEALGEYTIHADPDDWVEPDMLEELYRKAKEDDADMVICDFYTNDEKTQKYVKQRPSKLDHCTVLHELFQQLHGGCWNKLVKRVCYSKYGVNFPKDLSLCEDLYVNSALLLHDIKVTYVGRAFYHYDTCINSNSLVKQADKDSFVSNVRLTETFRNLLRGQTVYKDAIQNFEYRIVMAAFNGHYFSSLEFFENCRCYTKSVVKRAPAFHKVLYVLSCLGFYSIMYKLYKFVKDKGTLICS